jgi:excisionase family DNA binding protein
VRKSETYLPADEALAQIIDLTEILEAKGVDVPRPRPALDDGRGHRVELPEAIFQVLRQVAKTMSQGMGVTIAPNGAMLTTQEAAEFLGVSRPTLVKLLDQGSIPFELRGRHRRVLLRDLVQYQDRRRVQRRQTLADMVHEAEDADMYRLTAGPTLRR